MTRPSPPPPADAAATAGLLPCPFCGGAPRLRVRSDITAVCCDGCSCMGTPQLTDDDGDGHAKPNAISAWNRRASPPPSPVPADARGLVERLQWFLDAEPYTIGTPLIAKAQLATAAGLARDCLTHLTRAEDVQRVDVEALAKRISGWAGNARALALDMEKRSLFAIWPRDLWQPAVDAIASDLKLIAQELRAPKEPSDGE